VVLRFVELPSTDHLEIRSMAEFQALKEIPYSKEEIIVSFRNLGSYKDGFSCIMLAVMKRQLAEDMIKDRKIKPEGMRLWTELLYLYMVKKGIVKHDKVSLVVDIQKDCSEVIVIDKTKPVFSRGFKYKEDLLEEMGNSVAAYKRGKDNRGIEEVIISHGPDLSVENAMPHIKALFSCPVNFYEYKEGLGSLNLPLEIDLLPGEYVDKKLKRESARQLFLTCFLLFVALAMTVSFFVFKVHQKNKISLMLTEKTDKIQKAAEELNMLLKKTDILKSEKIDGETAINILKESYELAPGDILLSGFNYDGKDMLYCKGSAGNMASVLNFIRILERSKYFKKAEVKYATKRVTGNQEITDFNIACQVK